MATRRFPRSGTYVAVVRAAGGWSIDAAEQVAGAGLDMLQSLVEKSLVRFGSERYSLLELCRNPDLATEVPTPDNGGISTDGLTYTFKLRKNVRWHDKTPFTAADVKFTYGVVMLPGVDVRGRVGWDGIGEVVILRPTRRSWCVVARGEPCGGNGGF